MNDRYHHNVYVIELSPDVLEDRRFREANPRHDPAKACLYVGMTGLTPEERFRNHKAGIKANRYVRRYGLRLRPDLYAYANPMPFDGAAEMERELAEGLREEGHAVWQA